MGKADAYIGFAIKSGAVAFGAGAIEKSRHVQLLILDAGAAKNSVRLAEKAQRKKGCPMLLCKKGFSSVFGKEECKIAGITDSHLAAAILAANDEDYPEYRESEEVKKDE